MITRLDHSYSVEPKEDEDQVIKTLLWIAVGIPCSFAFGIGVVVAGYFIHFYMR